MIRHLYFIGNGFDLHHEIRSKYTDYAYWLIDHDLNLFYKIESTYGWPDEDWWSDFENEMGEFPIEEYTNDIYREYAPDYGSENFRERDRYAPELEAERLLSSLYSEIKKSFHKWISQLSNGNTKNKIKMDKIDSFFINFNYTPTLEVLYNIAENKIFYIHGKANRDQELILGHGKSIAQIERETTHEMPSFKSTEDKERWIEENETDYSYDRALETTIEIVGKQRKNVDAIIEQSTKIWNSVTAVSDIYVYGFSFSIIDIPYLKKVLSLVNKENVTMHISYYSNDDLRKAKDFVKGEHLQDKNVEYLKLCDIIENKS